jgi:pSer/pThr/pTyr-binding forkhead associated (FHA) protein
MPRFGLRYKDGWIPIRADRFTIGRSHECNLFLDDVGASRMHAVLEVSGEEVILENAASKNGVVLNGELMTDRKTLTHGDVIEIGSQRLIFQDERDDEEDEETGERRRRRMRETMRIEAADAVEAGDSTDAGSRPDTTLVEEAQQMLAQSDAGGAMGLMSIVVRRLVTAGQRKKPVEPQILSNTARCLVDIAAAVEQWDWVERLFEVYGAHGAMVASNVIDVVHLLATELRPRRSRALGDYYVMMSAKRAELSFEDRVVLQRLEGLVKLVGGPHSSVPPKPG